MNFSMSKSPIFIHSLFRAGSTYLFMVFRRSTESYWCYQEALHEVVGEARNNPTRLLADDLAHEAMAFHRHPRLDTGYFTELHSVWPAWADHFSESSVFAGYFAPPDANIGISYWRSLIQASKGRPVFQECRTPGRIGAIKAALGGFHIYLWRNPWDQWWSYKVAPYFDTANQLIVRAPHAPEPVIRLRQALGMGDDAPAGVAAALEYFGARPQNSEKSYLVFYMLWCLGLREGMRHADVMLNIDRLSDSSAYRDETLDALREAGVSGLDLSDCHVPQGQYLKEDRRFFEALEERVHNWLREGGWTHEELQALQAMRQRFEPLAWDAPAASCSPAETLEQASRARALARRYETHLADNISTLIAKIGDLEAEVTQVEAARRAEIAEARAAATEAESRATKAETELATVRKELHEIHQSNRHHLLLSEQRAKEIEALRASLSWRITAPLRWLAAPALRKGNSSTNPPAPGLVDRAIRWGMAQPQLVAFVHRSLHRYPKLRETITQRVATAMRAPVVPQRAPAATHSGDLMRLTPRARQIYADLKSAIERREAKD